MITVKTKPVRTTSNMKDFGKTLMNTTVEAMGKAIGSRVSKMSCEEHPNRRSVLILEVNSRGDGYKVNKSGFCCRGFAEQVQIKQ